MKAASTHLSSDCSENYDRFLAESCSDSSQASIAQNMAMLLLMKAMLAHPKQMFKF